MSATGGKPKSTIEKTLALACHLHEVSGGSQLHAEYPFLYVIKLSMYCNRWKPWVWSVRLINPLTGVMAWWFSRRNRVYIFSGSQISGSRVLTNSRSISTIRSDSLIVLFISSQGFNKWIHHFGIILRPWRDFQLKKTWNQASARPYLLKQLFMVLLQLLQSRLMMGVVTCGRTNFSNFPDSNQLQKTFTWPVAS